MLERILCLSIIYIFFGIRTNDALNSHEQYIIFYHMIMYVCTYTYTKYQITCAKFLYIFIYIYTRTFLFL